MNQLTAIVTRSYDAIEHADWDALDELFAPDCTMADPATRCENRDQMKETFQAYDQAFSALKFDIDHAIENADTVVVESTIRGVHTGPLAMPEGELPPTGRTIALRTCEVLRVSEGRIVSSHIYYDQAEFLSQLGVLEATATT